MTDNDFDVTCIIPAAGQGRRMKAGINKQFLKLDRKPVLTHTWRVFTRLSFIKEIILVVNENEKELCLNEVVLPYRDEKNRDERRFGSIKVIAGGSTRQASVYNGIKEAAKTTSEILIHDGARPLVTPELVKKVVDKCREYTAAIAAVPVKDTIKMTEEAGVQGREGEREVFIKDTPPRDLLWAAQTPQVFEKRLIRRAYEKSFEEGYTGTDDSSLVERLGTFPAIVESSYENLKVTTPEDIKVAENIFTRRDKNEDR